MEDPIAASLLNDFVFCPASIYFHGVDAGLDKLSYASGEQMQGEALHKNVDERKYSSRANILQSVDVYCEEYGVSGRIDLFDADTGTLTERKRKISALYDGQIYQVYAYCYALREMGYTVNTIRIHSMMDNRTYPIPLPEQDERYRKGFEETVEKMRTIDLEHFVQPNMEKCKKCVYEPLCSYTGRE